MPAPKGLHTYPEQLWTICEAVSVKRQEFTIECSRKEALNVRARFYGFRKALQRIGPETPEGMRLKCQQTLQWSWDVVPYLEGSGPNVKLRFMHKDSTPMARVLARAVPGEVTPGAGDAKLLEEARRLLEQEQEPVEMPIKTERDYG